MNPTPFASACLALPLSLLSGLAAQQAQEPGIRGERLPPTAMKSLGVEGFDAVLERQKSLPVETGVRGIWNGEDGRWMVPAIDAGAPVHSGSKSILNQWGDPRMAIAFPSGTDLASVWVAGHGGTAASAVRFVGSRGGKTVASTPWIGLGTVMTEQRLGFAGIDRLEVQLEPVAGRQGWIALDDLAIAPEGQPGAARVLDFEDLAWRQVLTGTKYAGLIWEAGTGLRGGDDTVVHAPQVPAGHASNYVETPAVGGWLVGGTTPSLWTNLDTARQGDVGANLIPPDTCGAVGPDHFVSITNANLSIYRKSDGVRTVSTSLLAFWPGSTGTVGDPRIVFDPSSRRFVALATNFNTSSTIYIAVSTTSDPSGTWFKFSFQPNTGTDAGKWPDYPTLGVDARGVYTCAYMVGTSALMSIFAIDKAPLVATTPSLGTVTAFRSLPWEGAIQPCLTYGDPGAEYFVSRQSATQIRLRRVNPPLTAPTLTELGAAIVPSHANAPLAPALGSTTAINTLDTRPMNAVYRNGSVWTAHNVASGSFAAVRWYEIGVSPLTTKQTGTITDTLWHYYMPSVAVDAQGSMLIGFSGSHANAYCGAYYAARLASDPVGTTSTPVQYKVGEGPWNRLDGSGRNRFGDYSHGNVDPVDDVGFWTIQQYTLPGNLWGTRTARVGFEAFNYGTGLAGTVATPFLRAANRPAIGQNLTIQVGNSQGASTQSASLVIGSSRASIPLWGGTVLVNPVLAIALSVPVPQGSLSFLVPNNASIVGVPVDFQALLADAGAPVGISFTPGLEVRCGSR